MFFRKLGLIILCLLFFLVVVVLKHKSIPEIDEFNHGFC